MSLANRSSLMRWQGSPARAGQRSPGNKIRVMEHQEIAAHSPAMCYQLVPEAGDPFDDSI